MKHMMQRAGYSCSSGGCTFRTAFLGHLFVFTTAAHTELEHPFRDRGKAKRYVRAYIRVRHTTNNCEY